MTTEKIRQAAGRQATQARQSQAERKIQQIAQGTAQEVRERVSNITGVPLGAPLDPSKGYSFDQGARPTDLPMPGEAPGGRPDRSQQSFIGNMVGEALQQESATPLPDDHDEIMAQEPPGAPQGRPRGPQVPRVQPGTKRPEHPILTKLRLDLGVESIKTVDVLVGGHRWTMALLTPADTATAARLADQLTDTPTERVIISQTVIGTYSVVAIDGSPTYQVMGVEPPPGVTITDHMRPPRGIRYLAAARLFDFVNDEGRTELAQRLSQAYRDKFDNAGEVTSYLDDPTHQRTRFRCPEEACGHELLIVPRTTPGTRDIQLPFCQWHGCTMEIVAEVASPLP